MLNFAIRNKSNNIMKHQYQSNYKPNEFLDVVDEFFNGKLKMPDFHVFRKRESKSENNIPR